jgi:hypothetical protein
MQGMTRHATRLQFKDTALPAAPLLTYYGAECYGAEEWARCQTLRLYLVSGELEPQILIPS